MNERKEESISSLRDKNNLKVTVNSKISPNLSNKILSLHSSKSSINETQSDKNDIKYKSNSLMSLKV